MAKYVYDKDNLSFGKESRTIWDVIASVLKYLLLSIVVATAYYIIIALVHDSEEERILSTENRYVREHYASLLKRVELLDRVIEGLQERDKQIYRDVFNTIPPSYRIDEADTNRLDISTIDSWSESELVWNSYVRAASMESFAARVSQGLELTAKAINRKGSDVTGIPSIIPIRNFNISSTGASVGRKLNPFFKTIREHNGIDLIAPAGEPVVASADGVVVKVSRGQKVFGNRIEISHCDGIVTTYSHLEEMKVTAGKRVKQGEMIGTLGSTGVSFAPHLHYEVIKNSVPMEPVYYFFADLTPAEFKEMLIMALTTGQSME